MCSEADIGPEHGVRSGDERVRELEPLAPGHCKVIESPVEKMDRALARAT
jgi:hypothetical protein